MAWITPIYDRTQTDIDQKTAKGYLNIGDLNRIEGNINYMATILETTVSSKQWTYDDLPTLQEMQRICANLNTLRAQRSFPGLPNTPAQPVNTYQKVNDIERMLFLMYDNYYRSTDLALRAGEGNFAGDDLI